MLAVRVFLVCFLVTTLAWSQEEPEDSRRPAELYLLFGLGNAVCDNDEPTSDCPVDGGVAFGLGGAWRFHGNFAAGLELAGWAFQVRDSWRGQLQDDANDVRFDSFYVGPFARWYWFNHGNIEPYLHGGFGFGSVTAKASNDSADYEYSANGIAYILGIGVEWKTVAPVPARAAVSRVSPRIQRDMREGERRGRKLSRSRQERERRQGRPGASVATRRRRDVHAGQSLTRAALSVRSRKYAAAPWPSPSELRPTRTRRARNERPGNTSLARVACDPETDGDRSDAEALADASLRPVPRSA